MTVSGQPGEAYTACVVKYRVAWHLLVYKRQHVGWHFTVFQHHTEHGYLVYRIAIGDVERGWGNLRHPRHACHIVDKALLLTSIHLQVLIERSLGHRLAYKG